MERKAVSVLMKMNRQVTPENIGTIIYFILKAKSVYNPEIGNIDSFINMYVNFALKTINRNKNKTKKEIPISVIQDKFPNKKFELPSRFSSVSEESELFSHIKTRQVLTKQQEDVIYRIYFLNEKAKSVAKSYKVSEQRISVIKNEAIEKLKCLKSELL